MIVSISANVVSVDAADVFTKLSVRTSLDDAELREAVAEQHLGVVDEAGGHVWLAPAVLLELAKPGGDAGRAGVVGMIEYAASKGWVDADGRVQTHIERPDAQQGTGQQD